MKDIHTHLDDAAKKYFGFLGALADSFRERMARAEASVAECACLTALEEKLAKMQPKAGELFGILRQRGLWLMLFFGILALLVILNLFIQPHHPHFGVDAIPGFWAVFGLGVGLVMVYVMKRIVQPLIVRSEDYYGDI